MIECIVPAQANGLRVDVFLSTWEDAPFSLTRNAVQKFLTQGEIQCNGQLVSKNHRLSMGELLTINIPTPIPTDIVAENIPLDIVYEDNDIIVINKPCGLVVHPAAGHFNGTLVNALLHHCKGSLSGIGGVERPGIVHRLDKDTSGLLVVAKNDAAHLSLSAQLADRTMGRFYHALCFGTIKKDQFTINQPISRHPHDRQKMAIRPAGRTAITHLTTLKHINITTQTTPLPRGRFTLVEAQLETGRTHQIRVHLTHIGHPVVGDTVYGPKKQPKNLIGHYLRAVRLSFMHPTTDKIMVFAIDSFEEF